VHAHSRRERIDGLERFEKLRAEVLVTTNTVA
jgi:hypothetical protein